MVLTARPCYPIEYKPSHRIPTSDKAILGLYQNETKQGHLNLSKHRQGHCVIHKTQNITAILTKMSGYNNFTNYSFMLVLISPPYR